MSADVRRASVRERAELAVELIDSVIDDLVEAAATGGRDLVPNSLVVAQTEHLAAKVIEFMAHRLADR